MADKLYGFRDKEVARKLDRWARASDKRPLGQWNDGRPGKGRGAILFRFTLTGGWSAGTAFAQIETMAGVFVESSAAVLDPEAIFLKLGVGDSGLCIRQGGEYYAVAAPFEIVTVVTDVQYSAGAWEKKTRQVLVWPNDVESAWTNIVTGTRCA